MLQHVLGVERSLAVPEEDDEIWVRADPGQLEQALVNVTLNARDALEDDDRARSRSEHAWSTSTRPRRRPCPSRRDATAHSASPTQASGWTRRPSARAAEPFFTTKQDRGGTGLGLPAVIGGVTQSGGAVRITSRLGAGTTVEILLPAAERPARPQPRRLDARPGARERDGARRGRRAARARGDRTRPGRGRVRRRRHAVRS